MEPGVVELITSAAKREIEKMKEMNNQPIILCSPVIRRHLRKLVERFADLAMIISHAEILQDIRIQALGKVTLKHGG